MTITTLHTYYMCTCTWLVLYMYMYMYRKQAVHDNFISSWVNLFIWFVMLWLRCFGCFVLYMWFEPSQLSCLSSSVGKSVRLASAWSWIRIPPEAVIFQNNCLWKITALGELCCVALSFCCVVLRCLLSEHFIDDLSHVPLVHVLKIQHNVHNLNTGMYSRTSVIGTQTSAGK